MVYSTPSIVIVFVAPPAKSSAPVIVLALCSAGALAGALAIADRDVALGVNGVNADVSIASSDADKSVELVERKASAALAADAGCDLLLITLLAKAFNPLVVKFWVWCASGLCLNLISVLKSLMSPKVVLACVRWISAMILLA